MCKKILATGFALITIIMAGSVYAATFQMDFTVSGLGPEDPISGSFTWEATSATAPIDQMLSVSLTIANHTYSIEEIGFLNYDPPSDWTAIGAGPGVLVVQDNTDDFIIRWSRDTTDPNFFVYATATGGVPFSDYTGSNVTEFTITEIQPPTPKVIEMNFTVAGLGPVDPISGSFTWEATSVTAPIDEMLSVSLTIADHTYSIEEIGFLNYNPPSDWTAIGAGPGVLVVQDNTDDFIIRWSRDTTDPNFFVYATATGGVPFGDYTGSNVTEFTIAEAETNEAPVAHAGGDQAIRAGDLVSLDGSNSFDDNTATAALTYSWSFASLPAGSTATLVGADTATPSFVVDQADTYIVSLIVTDEGGLTSLPDEVLVSADNLAPTANAGNDKLEIVATTVTLDGSGSMDPEGDPLSYSWSVITAPVGSTAVIADANAATATFVPDLEGIYEVNLDVADATGPGVPDTAQITATSAESFAEIQVVQSDAEVESLDPNQVTTEGNQTAFLNFLSQAVVAMQEGDTAEAIKKLDDAIRRTDGCALRGTADGNGKGRDWITDCTSQIVVYDLLNTARDTLSP